MSPQEIRDIGCKSSLTYSWWLSQSLCEKKGWTLNNVNTLWSCYLLLMEETVSWYEDLQIRGWWRISTVHSRLVVIVVLAVVIATVVIMYFHVISLQFQAAGSGIIDPTNTISRISPTYQKITFQRVLFRKLTNIPKKNRWLEEDVSFEMVPFQVTFVHFFRGGHHIFRKFHQIDSEFRSCSWNPANDVRRSFYKTPDPLPLRF